MQMIFRVRYSLQGAHMNCRVFVAEGGGTYSLTGILMMRQREFDVFRNVFVAEFIEEKFNG